MNTFSKNDTLAIKGVAIIFMVFAHLFSNKELCGLCSPMIFIESDPLVYLLIYAMNPVNFFIFLSGYGLYISYKNGGLGNGPRVFKLYIHYWLVLCIFVSIGYFMGIDGYPGNTTTIIENLTGWRNTYNHETWFLLPYSLLVLSASFLFKLSDKLKSWLVFSICFSIYIVIRFLSRIDGELIAEYQLFRWVNSYLTLLFPFMLGMLAAKCIDVVKLRGCIPDNSSIYLFLLILDMVVIILLRDTFQSLFYPFYVLTFILIFVLLRKPIWLSKTLEEFGKRSTSIWFIHTFFCYYLFQEFIYGFKYPLLIFVVLFVISYIMAILVDFLNHKIQILLKK